MKLIISLFFIFLFSCDNISNNKVVNKIENAKNIIEDKTKENVAKFVEPKKNLDKENSTSENIFYLIGDPYFIEGVKYTPKEDYSYSEVGLATFYDKELHNQKTLNNDLNKVTELLGRHKTLPLPSIVKITNLENGLSLTIKVIDRHDDNASVIQVSRKVAQLLRFYKNKIARVKVEILSDPSKQWKNVTLSINDKDFNNTVELNSTIYFCRINHSEFNYSSNPTYQTGSGDFVVPSFKQDPKAYITTVGLYNESNDLLAVAKLSQPILKSSAREAVIKVRLDF